MFKMSRITEVPVVEGDPDAYRVPEVDLAELARRLEPSGADSTALVAVREGHAPAMTRRSERVRTAVALPVGFTVWRVPYASRQDLVAEVCAAGADALVVEPAALREMVLEQLRAVVEGAA